MFRYIILASVIALAWSAPPPAPKPTAAEESQPLGPALESARAPLAAIASIPAGLAPPPALAAPAALATSASAPVSLAAPVALAAPAALAAAAPAPLLGPGASPASAPANVPTGKALTLVSDGKTPASTAKLTHVVTPYAAPIAVPLISPISRIAYAAPALPEVAPYAYAYSPALSPIEIAAAPSSYSIEQHGYHITY